MGVTLMAVLSGFGSICAGWETYFTPHRLLRAIKHKLIIRLVSEADVIRARTSVEMTQDLINEKQRKIRQLERRIHEKSQEPSSFMNRVVQSVRGSTDHQGTFISHHSNSRARSPPRRIKRPISDALVTDIATLIPSNPPPPSI